MTTTGWKRLWRRPRRASGGGLFDPPTARQRYLVEQSRARYRRRPDAYAPGQDPQLLGEFGMIESFQFITSPADVYDNPIDRAFQEAYCTGTGSYVAFAHTDVPEVTAYYPNILTTAEAIALVVDRHLAPIGPGYRVRSPALGVDWMAIDELWGVP